MLTLWWTEVPSSVPLFASLGKDSAKQAASAAGQTRPMLAEIAETYQDRSSATFGRSVHGTLSTSEVGRKTRKLTDRHMEMTLKLSEVPSSSEQFRASAQRMARRRVIVEQMLSVSPSAVPGRSQ